MIESALPRSATAAVELGVGTGFLRDSLAERRPQIDYRLVEPLPGPEQRLVEHFGEAANCHDRDFGGASHVALLDVLGHQSDDCVFLTEFAEKIDAGAMLLTVPALTSLWSQWDIALGHYRRYTKAMLAATVESLPFDLSERSYLSPKLIPLAGWRRLRGSPRAQSDAAEMAGFQDLPAPINEGLYRVASATKALRRLRPAGTSLFVALRRAT